METRKHHRYQTFQYNKRAFIYNSFSKFAPVHTTKEH